MARVRVGMDVVIGQRQIAGKPQPRLEDLEVFAQVLLEADEEQIVQPCHEVFLALEPLPVAVPDVGNAPHRGFGTRSLLIVHGRQGGRQPIGCVEALKGVSFPLAPLSGISGFPLALPAVEAADESADGIAHEEEELLSNRYVSQPDGMTMQVHDVWEPRPVAGVRLLCATDGVLDCGVPPVLPTWRKCTGMGSASRVARGRRPTVRRSPDRIVRWSGSRMPDSGCIEGGGCA